MDKIVLTKELKKEAEARRHYNIDVFSSLDRIGLEFKKIERSLLLDELDTGEKIYIQFPSKESKNNKDPNNAKPWDFRPVVDGLVGLSFKQIWDDLFEIFEMQNNLSVVATIFARMTYMCDHKLVTRELFYKDIEISTGKIVKSGNIELTYWAYQPDEKIVDLIKQLGKIRNVSFMSYLLCNDYLAQNEDCKYFYRSKHIKNEIQWDTKIGRHNTLLTHLSVIALIEKFITFTEIMDSFQRLRGVAPLPPKFIEQVTAGNFVLPPKK